jgi:hypothetical protein
MGGNVVIGNAPCPAGAARRPRPGGHASRCAALSTIMGWWAMKTKAMGT